MSTTETVAEVAVAWADEVKGRPRFTARELASFLLAREGTTARIMEVLTAPPWHRQSEPEASADPGAVADPSMIATPEPSGLQPLRKMVALFHA